MWSRNPADNHFGSTIGEKKIPTYDRNIIAVVPMLEEASIRAVNLITRAHLDTGTALGNTWVSTKQTHGGSSKRRSLQNIEIETGRWIQRIQKLLGTEIRRVTGGKILQEFETKVRRRGNGWIGTRWWCLTMLLLLLLWHISKSWTATAILLMWMQRRPCKAQAFIDSVLWEIKNRGKYCVSWIVWNLPAPVVETEFTEDVCDICICMDIWLLLCCIARVCCWCCWESNCCIWELLAIPLPAIPLCERISCWCCICAALICIPPAPPMPKPPWQTKSFFYRTQISLIIQSS